MAVWSAGVSFDGSELNCVVERKLTHQVLEDIHVSLFGDVLHFPASQLSQLLLLPLSCSINGGSGLKLKCRKGLQIQVSCISKEELPPMKQSSIESRQWRWITDYSQKKEEQMKAHQVSRCKQSKISLQLLLPPNPNQYQLWVRQLDLVRC